MKRLLFSLLLTGCCLPAFAQQEFIHPKAQQKQVMVQQPQPYIEIDGRQVSQPSLALISPNNIESLEVLKDKNATNKFGEKAKDGAILVHTNPKVEFITLREIYTLFGIPAAQQSLQVVINNQLIKDTSLIVGNLEQIEKVEVKKQDITDPIRWSFNDEEEFLYIISKPQTKQ